MHNVLSGFELYKINKGITNHFTRKRHNYFSQGISNIEESEYNRNYLKRFYESWSEKNYEKRYFEAVCFAIEAHSKKIDNRAFIEENFHKEIHSMLSNPIIWFNNKTIDNCNRRTEKSIDIFLYGNNTFCPEFAANNSQSSYGYTGILYMAAVDIITNGGYTTWLLLKNKDNYYIQHLAYLIKKSKQFLSFNNKECTMMIKSLQQLNGGDLVSTEC